MKRALILLVVLPALAILAAGTAFWLLWAGPGPTSEPHTIIVAQGSSLARVAAQLEEAGAIRGGADDLPRLRPPLRLARSGPGRRVRDSGRA